MESIKLTKEYIVEGFSLKEGTEIIWQPINPNANKFNNFLLTSEGGMVSEKDLMDASEKIYQQCNEDGLLLGFTDPAAVRAELFNLIKVNYARYLVLPHYDVIKEFLRTWKTNPY